MSEQRMKPAPTAKQLAASLGVDPAGVQMSGGRYENFRAGWVKDGHAGDKAHYFRRSTRDISIAISLCGLKRSVTWFFGDGNWTRCSICAAKARKGGLK